MLKPATRPLFFLALLPSLAMGGCVTSGSDWMAQPLAPDEHPVRSSSDPLPATRRPRSRRIGGKRARDREGGIDPRGGKLLGVFRNTYYDLPFEGDYSGKTLKLFGPDCKPIKKVPVSFYQTLCVQGSGILKSGTTASFHHRDCACAASCTKTGQRICFEPLDPRRFPHGRGATGKPIWPLRTIAVDTKLIPLGTPVYIPDYVDMPFAQGGSLQVSGAARSHDGCFIAGDRGLRVKGKHVDVFTGRESTTKTWNRLLPSNQGVSVIVGAPHCQYLKGHLR